MDLITIFKHGEQKLEICLEALAEHIKLGWHKVEEDFKAPQDKSASDNKNQGKK